MLNLIKRHRLGTILVLVGSIGMGILAVTPARANHVGCSPGFYSRCAQHGYFTDRSYNIGGAGTYVMSTGGPNGNGGMPTDDVNSFVNRIRSLLYDGSPGDKYQDTTGAAFIINTMLGNSGNQFTGRDHGVVHARNSFAEWEKRVRWYDSQGLVLWNTFRRHSNFENSLFDRASGDDSYYIDNRLNDDQFVILFHAPGHGPNTADPRREFIIKKNCGNPIGSGLWLKPVSETPPPPPPVTIRGRVFNWPSQLGSGGIAGVRIYGCEAGFATTDSNGFFTLTRPQGGAFCVRIDSGRPANSVGPYIRPWGEGVPGQSPGCPGFGSNSSSPTVNHNGGNRNYCAQVGYECQTAGVYQKNSGCPSSPFMDRDRNDGYDFAFRADIPPRIEASAQCPSEFPPNGRVRVTTLSDDDGSIPLLRYRVRVNGGAWSAYTDVNNPSVPFSVPNMESRNKYDVYTFEFVTQGAGPHGGQGVVERSVTVNYGRSSTRACEDRTFTATPSANVTVNDEEAPTSANFGSTLSIAYGPPGAGNGPGVKLSTTRKYFYVVFGNPLENPLSPAPGSENNRFFPGTGLTYPPDTRGLPPNLPAGSKICSRLTVTPASGEVDIAGNVYNPVGSATSPDNCRIVVGKPYFRTYNGDISAGFTASCDGWTGASITSSKIIAYNDGAGKGSGGQLGAFAIANIDGYTSATGHSPPPPSTRPRPPKGLSFANTSGTYGGMFGTGFCPPDYFAAKPATGITNLGANPPATNVGALTDTFYSASGNVTLSGSLADGKNLTIYIDGNVYIPAGGITNDGAWNTIQDIPSFNLVVKGNIYINANVTAIDGVYIAQPDTGGGRGEIVTCALGFGLPSAAELATSCDDQKLTVNGALMAKHIRLFRTKGSLKNSSNGELSVSPTIAETIIFSPEVWFRSSLPSSNNESGFYEAISGLPPIL